MRFRTLAAGLLIALAATLAACGSNDDKTSRPARRATLLLDFQPNAVHAGIFLAQARDYPEADGVSLTVRTPGQSTDPTRLLLSDRVQFAILDIHDLALARQKGRDLVGVMAIVERPLASVIAQPDIASPKDLQGRRVGVTGLPSDVAVLDSVVKGDGGDPAKVAKTTIGFDAVPAILGKKVSAATAFWNAEGVALQTKRPGVKIFKVDDYGAPPYPELVLTATRRTVSGDPDLVRGVVKALQKGYEGAMSDPGRAVTALVNANPGVERPLAFTEFNAVQPALVAPDGRTGTLDLAALRRWAVWEKRFGIVSDVPDVTRMFDPEFATGR